MGNKGAFITMTGKDLKPNFTTYEGKGKLHKKKIQNIGHIEMETIIIISVNVL